MCIKPYPGRIVCDIDGTDSEAEANALLISAAPDLFVAAHVAYGVLCSLSYLRAVRKSADYRDLNEACDLLAIAVNKSVGE